MLLDMRFAVRMYRRQLGVVSVSVVGLALALGISTVVYGVVSVMFLTNFGVPDPSSVVELTFDARTSSGRRVRPTSSWSYSDYLRLHESARLVRLEAYKIEIAPLGETEQEEVRVVLVSGGFFETLGVGAAMGRVLTDADDNEASTPAVVVNYNFWRRRMGGDESVIGQTVRLMGTPFTVVGVIEKEFNGPTYGPSPPEFWAPLATFESVWQSASTRGSSVRTIGRIAEGTTRQQAEAEVLALAAAVQAERADDGNRREFRSHLDVADNRQLEPVTLWVMATITIILGFVLLLACTNVANLLLAGAIARRREVGLRLALGASRARVVRQLLTESLMLSALSGGLGLLCAYWAFPVMATVMEFPVTVDLRPDAWIFSFLATATLLAGLGAGLAPARYGARGDLAAPLKGDAAAGHGRRPGRTRSTLVAVQAVASIVLLVLAALFMRAMVRVTQADLGFDADRLVSVDASFRAGASDNARAADYWQRVLDRVAGLPGVERAVLALHPPFGGGYSRLESFRHEGRAYSVFFNETSADYFSAVGIPVLRGRTYTPEEVALGAPVAVITDELATGLWGSEDALGATLERINENLSDTRVIGIVANTVALRLDLDATMAYLPLAPGNAWRAGLVVRTRGAPSATLQPVLEAVRAIDPELLPRVATVREGVEQALKVPHLLATMTGILGAIAVVLAVSGVFALTAFSVEQRTGEIGVRIAVGASTGDVVRLMMRDSLRPVAAGLVVGLLLVIAVGRILAAALYGISARDPLSILGAVVILMGAAAVAAAVPTRRAARVDPVLALRREQI